MPSSSNDPSDADEPVLRTVRTHGVPADHGGPALALENLARSPAGAGQALMAALSLLCFLEREGWPHLPGPASWALVPGALPFFSLRGPSANDPEESTRNCLAAFGAALGHGTRAVRRRSSPRRGTAAAWLAALLDAPPPLPGPGDLLLRLQADLPEACAPSIPPEFCAAFVWEAGPRPEKGLHRWDAGAERNPLQRGLRAAFGTEGPPGWGWECVSLRGASPFPCGGLEPLVRSALPKAGDPRAWLVDRLKANRGEGAALAPDLVGLFAGAAYRGLLVEADGALDPTSLEVLDAASPSLTIPVVLLGGGGQSPPLRLVRVRFPLLPPVAEAWYIDHLRALLGPRPDAWLPSLELHGDGMPRCGAPLLPPLPAGMRASASPHLGSWGGSAVPEVPANPLPGVPSGRRSPRAPAPRARGAESPRDLAAQGRTAALWTSACASGDLVMGRFGRGLALLLVGQPDLALGMWEGLDAREPALAGALGLQRARAYERTQDFRRALAELDRIRPRDLEERDRPWREIYRGHLLALLGRLEEAEATLGAALESAVDSDARAQALCHLASLALNGDAPEDALARIAEAETAAQGARDPLTRFLLLHRWGLALKSVGDYDGAAERLSAAVASAASVGFRRLEAGASCDLGNTLRMTGRHREAAEAYRRAEEGALGLGLPSLAEAARFDRAICLLERGEVLAAQAVFEEFAGRPAASPRDAAIHAYWLALALSRRGDGPGALEWTERGLKRMEAMSDPEVRLPLLLLRGEVLLPTGQGRKMEHLLAEVEACLGPRAEADDIVAACTLKVLAARGTVPGCEERARASLAAASPEARSLWKVALARLTPASRGRLLEEALREARGAPGPHAACVVLAEMAGTMEFPLLPAEERGRLRSYLVENRIAGILRDILPLLAPVSEPRREVAEADTDSPLSILDLWAEGASDALSRAARTLGAASGCTLRPGAEPEWAGEGDGALREALLSQAPDEGTFECPGGAILAARSGGGTWCAFARRRDAPPWGPQERALVRLLARLAPVRPQVPPPPPAPKRPIHPGVAQALLTRSPAMFPILESLTRAACFRYPVLLTGEPGVGKESCARALHAAWGPRKPCVAFNCANLTPTLASSQLFGHRRGAFTGADRDQPGLVEAARGGILFLDEVGELPAETQAQLLRFLQDGSYLPVGEVHTRSSDARVVAATNRDLDAMVASGAFRADLFHRINVIGVDIPPLRRRPEDIGPLFARFLADAARESDRAVPAVEDGLVGRLEAYTWPGNVRELQNLARALLVESHGESLLREAHLPARLREAPSRDGGPSSGGLAARLDAAERSILEEALAGSGGNLTRAAKSLGISRQALSQKLKRLGLRHS